MLPFYSLFACYMFSVIAVDRIISYHPCGYRHDASDFMKKGGWFSNHVVSLAMSVIICYSCFSKIPILLTQSEKNIAELFQQNADVMSCTHPYNPLVDRHRLVSDTLPWVLKHRVCLNYHNDKTPDQRNRNVASWRHPHWHVLCSTEGNLVDSLDGSMPLTRKHSIAY